MPRKILYSPGYGAGWVSWNRSLNKQARKIMLEHPPLVEAVERGESIDENHPAVVSMLQEIAKVDDHDPDYICLLGADKLAVEKVGDNTLVLIHEYDGHESIEEQYCDDEWI